MDVSRLLETRAREILAEAILKGMEMPSEFESRGARDDAKKRAMRAEAALDATMNRWTEKKKQLENHWAVIDPERAAAAKQLDEHKAALRMQAATVRQAMEDHGIDREQLEKKMDENDKLDADIGELLRKLEGEKTRGAMYERVSALGQVDPLKMAQQPVESVETSDVEMQ